MSNVPDDSEYRFLMLNNLRYLHHGVLTPNWILCVKFLLLHLFVFIKSNFWCLRILFLKVSWWPQLKRFLILNFKLNCWLSFYKNIICNNTTYISFKAQVAIQFEAQCLICFGCGHHLTLVVNILTTGIDMIKGQSKKLYCIVRIH